MAELSGKVGVNWFISFSLVGGSRLGGFCQAVNRQRIKGSGAMLCSNYEPIFLNFVR